MLITQSIFRTLLWFLVLYTNGNSTTSLGWLIEILNLTCPKISSFFPRRKLTVASFTNFCYWPFYSSSTLGYGLRILFDPIFFLYTTSNSFWPMFWKILRLRKLLINFLHLQNPWYKPQFPFTWISAVSSYWFFPVLSTPVFCPYTSCHPWFCIDRVYNLN